MVHGGVFFVWHPMVVVMVGPSTPGPQTPVAMANVECQDQQQAEHTHRASDHCCEGHRAERGSLLWGDCRTERSRSHVN